MILVDSHVHTTNSSDGKLPVKEVVEIEKKMGISYLCTTDHLDIDLKCGGHTPIPWKHIDLDNYRAEWLEAEKTKPSNLDFCFGIEAGFSPKASPIYVKLLPKYPFDCVINSVHFVFGWDVYFPHAFAFKSKKKVYNGYLDAILESLDAPYHYDVVAHIGYVTRSAPYRDKSLTMAQFGEKIDAILKGIIKRDKALEVNTHTEQFPSDEILRRYYELGGRKITFGSDSHRGDLCKDFEKTSLYLLDIGFTHFSVFHQHKETLVPIG